MALTDQVHTVRLPMPDLIVRGVSHTLYAPVYLSGELVAPTAAAAVSVYDPSNTAVIDAQTATITNSIAQYTIAAGDLTSYAYADKWRVEWSLPITGGPTLTPRNDASLVRNALWPVISDVDLFDRVPQLTGTQPLFARADFQSYLDEAWRMITRRLIRVGNRPNLILEPSALAEPHKLLALHLLFADMATRLNVAYSEIAAGFKEEYEEEWSGLNPRYDVGDDGFADRRRRSGPPTVSLCGGRDSWDQGMWWRNP